MANATVVGEDRELWSLLWLGYEAWSNIARPELQGVGADTAALLVADGAWPPPAQPLTHSHAGPPACLSHPPWRSVSLPFSMRTWRR